MCGVTHIIQGCQQVDHLPQTGDVKRGDLYLVLLPYWHTVGRGRGGGGDTLRLSHNRQPVGVTQEDVPAILRAGHAVGPHRELRTNTGYVLDYHVVNTIRLGFMHQVSSCQ